MHGQTAVQERSAAELSAPRSHMAVIINPATHGNANAIVALLRRHLPADVAFDIHLTPAANTATALAREALSRGAAKVVAVGGDGTVAEVAAALRGTSVPLGIVPGGSTNITARELGIPGYPMEAIALVFGSHRLTPLDAGLLHSRQGESLFLHMAGAGFDSTLFRNTSAELKRKLGWIAYLPSALHEVVCPPAQFAVVADGVARQVTSPLVLVANGRSIISPWLAVAPRIRSDDGWLDVLIFRPKTPAELLQAVSGAATREVDISPFVQHVRAREIELSADPRLPVESDGDLVTQTPVRITVVPAAVHVIVPLHRSRTQRPRLLHRAGHAWAPGDEEART